MKHKTGLFFILLILLFLDICGIKWGIPRSEYKKFFYGNKEEAGKLLQGVSGEYVKKSWKISKGETQEKKLSRATFNIIRSFHPDEENIFKSISNMNPEKFDFNPHFFEYPSFFIYLVAIFLKILSILNLIIVKANLKFYFLNPGEIGRMYIAGRTLTFLFSVLGCFFLYKTGERLSGKKTAFFSAFILALTPFYIVNSHYLTVDVPMVFWIIFSLYLLSFFLNTRKPIWLYLAGFTIGLASSTKYPAVFLWFLIPFVQCIEKQSLKKIFSKEILISFLLFIGGFACTSPYIFLSFPEFKRDLLYQMSVRGFGDFEVFGRFIAFSKNMFTGLWTGASSLTIIFLAGIIYVIAKRGKTGKFILAGFILSIFPLLLSGGFKFARYYLIVLPFLALAGGTFLSSIFSSRNFKFLKTVVIAGLFITPTLKSFSYSFLMNRKDARILTAEYISGNIPADSTIVFTKDPWIFEVPPVNLFKYNIKILSEENLYLAKKDNYLIIGELQYFLTYGSRKFHERELVKKIKKKGYNLVNIFQNEPEIFGIKFDNDVTIHDMIYTHPKIFLFQKKW